MAKGYIFDKLLNRKIEGETNLALREDASLVVTKSNINELSDEVLSSLKVGDVVQKKTGNQKHCYIVTYKEENHGICLSYFDAGYLETVSYDYSQGHWVYNSTDICNINANTSRIWVGEYIENESAFNTDMKAGDIIIDDAYAFVGIIKEISFSEEELNSLTCLGLCDELPTIHSYNRGSWSEGELIKGTKLYKHIIVTASDTDEVCIISTRRTPYDITNLTIASKDAGVVSISVYNDIASTEFYCYSITFSSSQISNCFVMSANQTPQLTFDSFEGATDTITEL